MAEPQTLSRKIGLTRGKAMLIGILAIALVGVIYLQYGGTRDDEFMPVTADDDGPSPTLRSARLDGATSRIATPPEADAGESALAASFNPARWKSPDLSKVIAYDPFALPDSFPRPPEAEIDRQLASGDGVGAIVASADADRLADAIERLQLELEELQQRGVQVIVRGRDQYVAMIGDRMVQVGDEIGSGFTITAIEADGVRVERKVDE